MNEKLNTSLDNQKVGKVKRDIYMVWFGLVLWHINQYRLFNAKSCLFIYIKYIGFSLVWFYGISIIVDYSMPIPVYTYILNICGTELNE